MRRVRTLSLLLCVPFLVLVGCAPETPTTVDTTPPKYRSAEFRTVPATEIAGLSERTTNDEHARLHVTVPQLNGQDRLNGALRDLADAQVAEYKNDVPADGAGFLSVTWSALGSDTSIVGLLVSGEMSPGASTARTRSTFWYDTREQKILQFRDLVTAAGLPQVVDVVRSQLQKHFVSPDLAAATRIMTAGRPSVGFDATGRLLVGFNSYDVAAGADGAPVFTIDIAPEKLLTRAGAAARTASLSPRPIETPAAPPPVTKPAIDCAASKCVALTFDDGPSSATTPRLLDILKKEQVRATFFVLGSQVHTRPDLVARERAEGHEIGNHSWSHPQLTSLTPEALRSEISRTNDAIEKASGARPVWMRPPYGAHDAKVDDVVRAAGMAEAFWSIDTLDWQHHSPAKTGAAAAQAKPGAVILMHDIHQSTIDAVPDVIRSLRAKGYVFVTVSELVGIPSPGKQVYGTY